MPSALLFDIGGVLADDVWEHLLLDEPAGLAARYGLDRAQVLQTAKELWLKFEHRPAHSAAECAAFEGEYWALFGERFNIGLSIDDLIAYTEPFIRPIEGMSDLLIELKAKGHTLVICSNNNEFWYQRQAAKCNFALFFDPDKIILSNRIGASKWSPNFEMFHAAVQAAGMSKEQCVFIDDRAENMERAAQFGLPAILFPARADHYGADYLRMLFRKMALL